MDKRTIPYVNYPALFNQNEAEFLEVMRDVCRRGAFIMQRDLSEFEANLAKYLGVKHAVGLADGTMALFLAMKAAGIKQGDEVLVPSHTFIASAAAVHHAGATPVLTDSAADHLMEPSDLESKITPRTRAILPVHLNGRTCRMDAILEVARKHNLKIIEDACQALGSQYKGQFAGTFGLAGAFSFYPAKTLGCFGDGGALVTNDDEVASAVMAMRDHGRGPNGNVSCYGFSARLDNFQAAILDLRLKRYQLDVERRRAIGRLYNELLKDEARLVLPPPPDSSPDHFDVFQNYEVEADRRDELKKYLADNGVGTIMPWGGKAIHQFEALQFSEKPENAERMSKKWLLLPLNVSLSDDDIHYICGHIRDFYKNQ